MNFTETLLFGGAITSDLPANWKDISDVRPIPNNQECFQDSLVSDKPIMLIVEILERQGHIKDEDAASFFFNELAEQNDALQTQNDIRFQTFHEHAQCTALLEDDSIAAGKNTVCLCAGSGYQKVALGRDYDNASVSRRTQQEIKCIRVDLYLFRLKVQDTDLVISISTPVDDALLNEMPLEASSASGIILNQVVSTFRIRNWDLFG
mmetsp:Transcript_7651/g.15744  ORF Transcript_7651/g.15744 Transcript_7651/m.15744 type:complete len:207 (+) Transcript_7651:64-684(+)